MKRTLLLLSVICMASLGCQHHRNLANNGCKTCGSQGRHASRDADKVPRMPLHANAQRGMAGPPTAAYRYPYYTTRGPRDFLMGNPPTIGR